MDRRWKTMVLWGLTAVLLGVTAGVQARQAAAVFSPSPKYLALTFDDGPRRSTTTQLLDGLAKRGVKASFFLIGRQVERNQALVSRMDREGHQLGVHTWSHVALNHVSRGVFDRELAQTRACLTALTGEESFMLRPPYGFVDGNVRSWANAPIVCWSVDTRDWERTDPEGIARTMEAEASDGDIILMHDIYDASVEAALAGVDRLLAQGYSFVTVEELFALRGVEPMAGEVYCSLPP